MEKFKLIIYWASYAYYLYVFGYASLFKVFKKPSMMSNMKAFGFNERWTILIGVFEVIGVLLFLAGLYKPSLRAIAILFLFPFAIGAFTTHMAYQDYQYYYNSLIVCILSVVMLWADSKIKIVLQ